MKPSVKSSVICCKLFYEEICLLQVFREVVTEIVTEVGTESITEVGTEVVMEVLFPGASVSPFQN